MYTLKIYVTDSLKTFNFVNEEYTNVKEHKVENGMIHITFDVESGLGGIHFPIPYNFAKIEMVNSDQ